MNTSESINEIAAAMAKAQAVIMNPIKTKTNPHFKSSYADLASGLDVIRPALSAHGIAIFQATEIVEDGVILKTRLVHSTGQWIESTYPVSKFAPHQQLGAALTYSKRQALFSLVGVCGDDDDDGNSTAEVVVATTQKAPAKKAAKPVEPTLSPEDSATLYETMLTSLNMVSDIQELYQWARDNQANKVKLTPVHQQDLTVEFRNVEAAIRAN
jgi:ERF superfamily